MKKARIHPEGLIEFIAKRGGVVSVRTSTIMIG